MKTQFHKFLINTAVLLLLLLLLPGRVLAENYTASTIRLLYYEGNVKVLDADGKSRTLMQNGRFGSGEAMQTGKESTASVGLDQSKIVALDAVTRVNFSQQGKAMRMDLVEGTLLLDVQKKLDDEESLDIRTSNMVVGIRGTVVFLSNLPSAEHGTDDLEEVLDERISSREMITTLGVLEGTAHVSYVDANGRQQSIDVKAGEKATLRGDSMGKSASDASVETMEAEDLSNFVVKQLMRDDKLYDRVEDATGLADEAVNLYAADKDWTYDGPITLVAQSASKLYDGTALIRPTDVLVYGLPKQFSIRVSANGSQTDAGSSKNPISTYSIFNARGEDVTKHFTDIRTVDGELVVDPKPLTVWTASAEKVYDGTPLTAPDAWLSNAPHYKKEPVPWRNMAYVQPDTGDVQVLYGICGTVWVHGTNPLTGETQEIELRAGQRLLVYLHDEKDRQTISLTLEGVKETELTDELLRLYADNPDLLDQAVKDTGWDAELMTRLINDLPERDVDPRMVTKHDLQVEERDSDSLMKDCTNVRITIDTEITDYNDRALGSDEARYTPIVIDETISVRATGSRTEVGTSINTYSIDWGNAKSTNYTVNEELGTLTVIAPETPEDNNDNPVVPTVDPTPPEDDTIKDPVVLTAASASKVYDGSPLTDNTVSVSGLPDGYTCTATAGGSRTDAGSSANTVDSYTIYDKDGKDVTSKFTNVTTVDGTLTVEAIQMDFNLGGREVDYDGSAPVPKPTFTYLNGEHAGEIVSGVRLLGSRLFAKLAAPPAKWSFSLYTGDAMSLSIQGGGSSAGTYTLVGLYDFTTGSKGNYTISYSGTTMTIKPAPLHITTGDGSKKYDGTPLSGGEATVEGLMSGDAITVTTAAPTEVGTTDNTYTIDWGDTNKDNYTITDDIGELTITKNDTKITVTAGSASRAYNGEDLTDSSFTVEGLPDALTLEATTDGSQYIAGTTKNVITDHKILNSDGEDRTENFTNVEYVDGTLEVTLRTIAFWSWPAIYTYDGWSHSATIPFGLVSFQFASADNIQQSDFSFSFDTYRDVGSHTGSFTVSFRDFFGKDLSHKYTIIYEGPNGSEPFANVIIQPRDLTVSTTSESKVYDGEPLKGSASLSGRVGGDNVKVTADTTITDVGSAANNYTIDWGTTKQENYTLIEDLGTLTVTPATLTVVTDSDTKTYDGTPLTAGAHLEGLSPHDDATVEAKGTITDPGVTTNSYEINWGTTNPDNYVIVEKLGQLSITNGEPAPLTVITESASKTYDGTPLTADARLVGLKKGADATVKATGTITHAGSTENTYEIDWGETDPNDYTITEDFGTLTVEKADLTVTTDSASKTYDGKPLTATGASLEGLCGTDDASATATGTITNAGSTKNGYEITWNSASRDDYTIKEKLGTLTVEKATLYVSTGYAHKFYDGKPLTCDEASIEGLQNDETAWVTATGTITDIGYTENTYKLTWGTANPDNYKIEEYLGWLGIYDPDDPEIPDEEPLLSSPENALEAGPKPDAKKESDAAKDSKTEKGSKAEKDSNVEDGSKAEKDSNVEDGSKAEKDSNVEDGSKAEKSSDTDRDSKAEMKAGTETSSGAEAGKNPEAEMNSGSETRSEAEKSSETEKNSGDDKSSEAEQNPGNDKSSEAEQSSGNDAGSGAEQSSGNDTGSGAEQNPEPEKKPETVTMPEPENKPRP